MNSVAVRPLWAGRTLVLLGILLLALNLRTAVAALSPIVGLVSDDVPLDALGLGVIGMLPPIAFAVSGLLAPLLARRIGLETTVLVACAAMVAGPVIRALSTDYFVLVFGSIVALAGMGFGNIMLPPVVKKYFPDRIGQLTAVYATILAISASVPAILAAPVANATNWRVSLGLWAALALCALLPWFFVWFAHRRESRLSAEAGEVVEPDVALIGRLSHSPTAWAITAILAVSAFNVYALFAWLPSLLADVAGVDPIQAGALLALYGVMGLPFALVIPVVAARMRNVGLLVYVGIALFIAGYLGLLFIPTTATWLWVLFAGSGPIMFPLALVLINLRTKSAEASVALSGFVQGFGYAAGALGPLVVAIVHSASDGWTVPMIVLIVTSLLGVVAARVLSRNRMVEDELAARAA